MSSKEKVFNNIIKIIFIILFLVFLTIYFSQSAGYYDFELHKKSILTKEKMEQFEKDIADGKDVKLENYLVDTRKDYSNKTSDFGYFLSKNIGKYIKDGIENTFKMINNLVE